LGTTFLGNVILLIGHRDVGPPLKKMPPESQNTRLETFCDGVFAIAITLLILEIERPNAEEIRSSKDLWHYLLHLLPSVYAFLLSFVIIGVQWATHACS
jgi:TMEM175 potassium channel family protein